ncbi:MAG: acyl-CoA dehydrogenase family protein [Nitrospirae bacterium]|nr:acyl-CoA dehydrogenase family protein [Nitrospirota bacterium]
MEQVHYDVIVVGAGPGGVTAAATAARAGASVLLLEAGAFAGAENWSGCVYFAESLLHPDAFGPDAIHAAPFERRLVKRGVGLTDGETLIAASIHDADTFSHCYTVLRPVFDPHWAELARGLGATVLADTTVTSLIRRDGRVVGVHTSRGPAYADITFLAEGDASHLVRHEGLERVAEPGFSQGVKAVYRLGPDEIQRRFGVAPGEGAANEVIVRNASFGGRSLKLNMAAFVYTNRDTLSVGYAMPLANLASQYRGRHEELLAHVARMPGIAEYLEGAELSAFGAKLIRTGGITRAPRLVEDGLAVGGAAAALGIDAPYPNFTGPAAATGLYFGRAVATLARTGQAPTQRNLRAAYLEPLKASRYWKDAEALKAWPDFLEHTATFFGPVVDVACGTTRYLTDRGPYWTRAWNTARLLRDHLAPRRLGAMLGDKARMGAALGATPHLRKVLRLKGLGRMAVSSVKRPPRAPGGLSVTIRVNGEHRDLGRLPLGLRGPARRQLAGIGQALAAVYRNGAQPFAERVAEGVDAVTGRLRLLDLLLAGAAGAGLLLTALLTALYDLFRFKVLKVPAEQVLDNPVNRDNARLKALRELEGRPDTGAMAARLATNTYRPGATPHIRVLWPDTLQAHSRLADAPYWSVCPAGVYAFAPSLAGHGLVTVNHENCVKCESCWQSAPDGVLWGRHTDHQLIYRPHSAALDVAPPAPPAQAPNRPRLTPLPTLPDGIRRQPRFVTALDDLARLNARARAALVAFEVAVDNLPPAADRGRTAWPERVARAARHRLHALEAALSDGPAGRIPAAAGMPRSPFAPLIGVLEEEAGRLSALLATRNLFEAAVASRRIRETVLDPLSVTLQEPLPAPRHPATRPCPDATAQSPAEAALRARFGDQAVKRWDREGIDATDATALCALFDALPAPGAADPLPAATLAALRAWAALHSGVALLALHRVAANALGIAGGALADGSELTAGGAGALSGTLALVPARLAETLIVLRGGQLAILPLDGPGVTRRAVRAGGMHPAGFSTITLDNAPAQARPLPAELAAFLPHACGAIALGAGDYLARRAVEQALGRIQFPGQMQDPAGHDSIAKFGAVKALVARTLAWRELLDGVAERALSDGAGLPPDLLPALARMAFSPRNGRMGYDAGQVFGGTGYSEDEQMSRCYRDSAVFPHLPPALGALERLAAWWQESDAPLAARVVADDDTFADLSGGPLADHLAQWQDAAARIDALAIASEPAREALALAIACYHQMTRVARRLEAGLPVEGEAAALETLLGILADLIAQAQGEQGGPAPALAHFPELPDRDARPLALSYDALIHMDDPYESGDFLRKPPGGPPRFIPEIQLHDPELRVTWEQCYRWFLEHCSKAPDDGGFYEHYIERRHTIPAEMLEGFKQNGMFASVVPARLDGLGWKKIGYYLLVSGAMRHGDASLSLLIMASTSIGTTPALIGLDKEIPLVEHELGAFRDDPARLGAIAEGLAAVVAQLASPDPKKLERDVTALADKVDATIRRTKVVKYLAQNFLMAFYGAALAGRRKDFGAFSRGLREAQERLRPLPDTLLQALAELPRRRRAAEQFLRALGHGAVAGFALTEPTAGSDSGGVTTTAHLKEVPVTLMGDGRYRFEIDGRERFLLDADRIVFGRVGTDGTFNPGTERDGLGARFGDPAPGAYGHGVAMGYRLQDGAIAPISHAGYDHATDRGTRTVRVREDDLPFHDIAQVRDGNRYAFYEVSGAKMWITNGRVATQFSMYVKTDEGITGLLVDRHAEGLIVGRDEEKMGQQGSPTNELSIDRMRVPRENVIGYEGHGQVNALETLNVGRCGLAVAGVVMTRRILVEAKAGLPPSDRRDRALAEVAARVFANESLAFHLVGRFDNKATRSVRLESAIAKYACSELLHEALDRIEPLWGPIGQTRDMLVEKMRRDARILNIYEGTNEVQRFLILRELCAMAADWPEQDAESGRLAALASWKNTLRRTVAEAVATLGDAVWQDAAMQPAFFPLAEMAGELYLLDTTLYRLEWIAGHRAVLGADYADPMTATGERAVTQCLARLQALHDRYDRGRAHALASRYPAEAVASDAAMEPHRMAAPRPAPLARKAAITCLLRPVAVPAPTPRLNAHGHLAERVWRANPADAHALAQALALRAGAAAPVSVAVASCGGPVGERLLREALGAGADRAVLLDLPAQAAPAAWADALAGSPEADAADLILCGATSADADAPLGPFLAGRLGRALCLGDSLSTRAGGAELLADGAPLPEGALLALADGGARPLPTLAGMARAMAAAIAPPGGAHGAPTFERAAASGDGQRTVTTVDGGAELLRHFAESARRMAAAPYGGEWEQRPHPADGVWALAQAHEAQAVVAFRAARELADALGLPAFALASGNAAGLRRLAGAAQGAGITLCLGIDTAGVALSESGRRALLASVMKGRGGAATRVVAPAPWAAALGFVAGTLGTGPVALSGVTGVSMDGGRIAVRRAAYGGTLSAVTRHPDGASLWLAVDATAPFTGGAPVAGFALARPAGPRLAPADLDPHFALPVADLRTAEVIVDMGLGAGSEAGLRLARELMEALSALSLSPHLGATRKITQGLGLLPQSHQIGQTGVAVNPKVILALGISGAPQHTDYIGGRAHVLAFNKDPDAPLMRLTRPGCTVHPIVGDLFDTVPELIRRLRRE